MYCGIGTTIAIPIYKVLPYLVIVKVIYRVGYTIMYVSFLFQLRSAAENDTPVYFMITPPNEPGYLTDVYVDTTTLEWAYQPPVPVIAAQTPEHMNLSSTFV